MYNARMEGRETLKSSAVFTVTGVLQFELLWFLYPTVMQPLRILFMVLLLNVMKMEGLLSSAENGYSSGTF